MNVFLQYVIPSLMAVVVAIIEAIASKERKETKKERERLEEQGRLRAQESALGMKLSDANMQLTLVVANALTGGHNNGNVEKAKKSAEEAKKEYDDFLIKSASNAMYKEVK